MSSDNHLRYLKTYGPASDVGCKTVANMIKGKTPEEIRKLFNIVNDFTPEEEVSHSSSDHEEHASSSIIMYVGSDQEGERELLVFCFQIIVADALLFRNGRRIVR